MPIPINLYLADKELNVLDSINVENYPIIGVSKDNIFYNICRKEGSTCLVVIENKVEKKIELTIKPQCLISQKSNYIIIGGNRENDDNQIDLLSYNVITKKSNVIKEFKGYSIIQGLQSNDKVIAGFIGNISGAFTKYDLFYSLDQGKTWHIKKLEEASYIRPSCLVSNVMYIYSGGARMQKIIFEI